MRRCERIVHSFKDGKRRHDSRLYGVSAGPFHQLLFDNDAIVFKAEGFFLDGG